MRSRSLPMVIVTGRSRFGSDAGAESTRTIDRLPRGQARVSTEPHDHAILSPPCLAIAVIAYAKSTPRTTTARCATSIGFDASSSVPTWTTPNPDRRDTVLRQREREVPPERADHDACACQHVCAGGIVAAQHARRHRDSHVEPSTRSAATGNHTTKASSRWTSSKCTRIALAIGVACRLPAAPRASPGPAPHARASRAR